MEKAMILLIIKVEDLIQFLKCKKVARGILTCQKGYSYPIKKLN